MRRLVIGVVLAVALRSPSSRPMYVPRHRRPFRSPYVPAGPGRRAAVRACEEAVGGAA